jgi:hypothetical protein
MNTFEVSLIEDALRDVINSIIGRTAPASEQRIEILRSLEDSLGVFDFVNTYSTETENLLIFYPVIKS